MLGRIRAVLDALADGRTKLRRELEEVFNRKVLGSVLVTSSLMKMVEKGLNHEPRLLGGWAVVFFLSLWIFVKWHTLAEYADDAVEKAAEAADDATD